MATSRQIGVSQNRYALRNRFLFTGELVMRSALHIGGGRVTLSSSDSPVVLTPEQKPYIPGSSFKGALRSTVEKIVSSLPGFSSCALIELSNDKIKSLGGDREAMKKFCPTVRQSVRAAWALLNSRNCKCPHSNCFTRAWKRKK